jgi:hypothetical protein
VCPNGGIIGKENGAGLEPAPWVVS